MPGTSLPADELARQVRNALAHLYDHVYLQNHPLAAVLDASGELDKLTRAQKLRRLLLDCIEALRPQGQEGAPSEAARAHAILTYRYVDGVSIEEIAAKRALTERQIYRELEKGVEAVTKVLRDRLPMRASAEEPTALGTVPVDPLQALQAEVDRLQQTECAEPLDLGDVLDGVLTLLAPVAQSAGVELALFLPTLRPQIVADRVMLRQALLSLLSQAVNASHGQATVTVTSSGNSVRIVVQGSPANTAASSVAPWRTPGDLALAQALIEAQGGHLNDVPQSGQWTATVELPLKSQPLILAVDDNQDLVALLERYLAGREVQIVGATDSDEAIRLATELSPQLITLDVMMPRRDGWEILQRLKDSVDTADIPVVICSVVREAEIARAMGAADYITKPASQSDFLAVITRWLGPLRPAD